MIDKVFSVYDLHDENVLLQKATIKAEIAVLTEEKSKLETNLQETKNVVAVEMQALQRELESIQGEIQTNNSAIADLEDEKTRLTTEIEPLRYEKGNLLS
jgi:predicted  nucleic acid-binding Zn-ribbon protein